MGTASILNQDQSGGTCDIVLSEITHPELIRKVEIPVWSDASQSDIYWYTAGKQRDSSYLVQMNLSRHKYHLAEYTVHVYMTDVTGNRTYQTQTACSFAMSGQVTVSGTEDAALFYAEAADLIVPGGWSSVRFAVWSDEENQDDLKWYLPSGKNITINLADYKHDGLFHVHCYIVLKSGELKFLGESEFTAERQKTSVSVGESEDGITYPVAIKNISVSGGVKSIRIAVWSQKNGQDDLKWYTAEKNTDGSCSAVIDIRNHKTEGQYYVHAYALTNAGKMQFLGETNELYISPGGTTDVSVENVDENEGTFTVTISVKDQTCALSGMQVPVWCEKDQSDIHWYAAKKQEDGVWTVQINTSLHQSHSGSYKIHVYGTFANGIFSFLQGTSQEIQLSKVAVLDNVGAGKRTVVLRGASDSVQSVSFPVWSVYKSQDDLKWYTASKDSNGNWTAVIDCSGHKNAGTYAVHCYADGKFAGNTSFVLNYNEIKTEYTELAASMQVSSETDQLILVAAEGTTAKVAMLNKNEDGSWFQLFAVDGYVGRGGVGETTEWNGKTPQGVYGFTKAFGIKADPGTSLDYTQVDSTYYWVDDVDSVYYNQFVTTREVQKDWDSAEHLIDYTESYAYCLALDYNPQCIPGVGSAIFLHCSTGRATGGCIAVPESVMKKIMQNVQSDCKIVIE